jgi:hypothetical protein
MMEFQKTSSPCALVDLMPENDIDPFAAVDGASGRVEVTGSRLIWTLT